jgi:hypothetical protein
MYQSKSSRRPLIPGFHYIDNYNPIVYGNEIKSFEDSIIKDSVKYNPFTYPKMDNPSPKINNPFGALDTKNPYDDLRRIPKIIKKKREPSKKDIKIKQLEKEIEINRKVMSNQIDNQFDNQKLKRKLSGMKREFEELIDKTNNILDEERINKRKFTTMTIPECLGCMDAPCEFIGITCGHLTFCEKCKNDPKNKSISKCPICNQVTELLKIYV